MKLSTKRKRNDLASNLISMGQVIDLALKAMADGEKMWDGQEPEQVLKNISNGLWQLGQELKEA